ncbi:MAG: CRISPR-associated ring nuclease [Desulfosoma sp.]|uniref:CRISPR-associated ring nuclease n=1 Tax=Desulfosoma sp. TaxID=2603217 RepID=UPI00404AF808
MARVLITTLGRNWEIVPEILGWTNPDLVDFYRHHPHRQALDDLRAAYGIEPVERVWIITTDGPDIDTALHQLRVWRDAVRADAIRFRVVRVSGIEDLSSLAECRRMREAIHQVVFRGFMEAKPEGMLVLSLTGGRKTMSSDMQAAAFFGCRALIHIVGRDDKLVKFKQLDVQDFCRPLASYLADAVTPVVVGRHARSPLMDYPESLPRPLEMCVHKALQSEAMADASWIIYRLCVDQTPLLDTLEDWFKTASNLAANHASRIIQQETSANFLALYSLPPREIQRLKETKLGVALGHHRVRSELELLRRLPKAELHCHLGGALTVEEILDVARALEEKIKKYQAILQPWLDQWKSRLETEDVALWGHAMDWKALRRPLAGVPEPIPVAAFILLFQSCPHVLEEMIYGPYLKEENFVGIGFNAYERLGDLQGSALLQCEETLRAACRILGLKARDHHVLHLEVRCSPHNYTRGSLNPRRVVEIIADELAMHGPESTILLLIGSRHKKLEELRDSVALAEELIKENGRASHMLVGFDLAGDEKALEAVKVRETFLPLMERCLHATIHAGEIADASSIWQAVYHLNAERIGHGLTLQQNPDLLERFRDRRIAVEMCPSSNYQILGFRDAHVPGSASLSVYPLFDYLQKGLRVTVNTDNPGISRTDFSKEYHRAGRLTPNGLSLWDVLLLIRNGFKAAFTEAPRRHNLLRKAENMILQVLERGFDS